MVVIRGNGYRLTLAILATNAIIFLLGLFVGTRVLIALFGLVPKEVFEGGHYYTLITSMFVHADFFHIFFNMLSLLIFGRDVEEVMGSRRFLLLYFFSGIVGGLFYASYSYYLSPFPGSTSVPAVGASGAIFGVMAAYAVFFPNRPLAVFFMFIPLFAKAYVVITIIVLIQTILALSMPFSPIAYTAHVGGFLAGMAVAIPFKSYLKRVIYWYYR